MSREHSEQLPPQTNVHTSIIAPLLLAVVAVLYVVSLQLSHLHPQMALLKAFSEAALVGAIADWFAVTALFRRPFGLPIPHTAIVPANQKRIAHKVAEFISENFFSKQPRGALANEVVGSLTKYLANPQHRLRLTSLIGRGIRSLLSSPQGAAFTNSTLQGFITRLLETTSAADVGARSLEILFSGQHQQRAVSEVLHVLHRGIAAHRELLTNRVVAMSPWFLPQVISQPLSAILVSRFATLTREMAENTDHPAREELRQMITSLVTALRNDQKLRDDFESLKSELVGNSDIRLYTARISSLLYEGISEDLSRHDSTLLQAIDEALQSAATVVSQDNTVREEISRIADTVLSELSDMDKSAIERAVRDTIESWDSKTLVEKLEGQVARDLQFIRVNGTLVGGLVGIVLYALHQLSL